MGDIKFSVKGLEEFNKKLERLQGAQIDAFFEACAKELAARLLRLVIHRTPVGDYTKEVTKTAKRNSKNHKKGDVYTETVADGSGRKGGVLRRGWTSKTYEEAKSGEKKDAAEWANSMNVERSGGTYKITVYNPVPYAPYVEYGHRTRGGKGWVEGRFMLTLSEQDLEKIMPKVLESKLEKFLKDNFR